MKCSFNKTPGHLVCRLSVIAAGLTLFTVFLVNAPTAFGQGSTGAINGTIADASGAVIPGAKVVLQSLATSGERVAIANATGSYVFPEVLPGNYTIQVSAQGFATSKEGAFTLNVDQTETHNFTLTIGPNVQEVTVSGASMHVEASTAELGTAIAATEVNDLPLNGRNFLELLTLTPGISPINTAQNAAGGGIWAGNTIGSFTYPSVNGQCNRCNLFLLDGFMDQITNMSIVGATPIIDGIQEFKVQSHNDTSQYGGAVGGLINVATRGGTNQYHGDVWEFLRNNDLDSRNFFFANTIPYKQNQFGGVFGGPLLPSHFRSGAAKTWFFISFEGFRSVKSSSTLLNVVTPAELTGDLSALTGTQIYNPFSTAPDPAHPGEYTRSPFMCDASGNALPAVNGIQAAGTPCNKIPASMIDQNLVKFVQAALPTPINTGVVGYNAIDSTPNFIPQEAGSLRLDHQFTTQTSAWARYTGFDQPDQMADGWPGTRLWNYFHGYQAAGTITHAFSDGSKVLSGGFALVGVVDNEVPNDGVPPNLWSQVGFSPNFAANFTEGYFFNPSVLISGFNTRPSNGWTGNQISDIYEGRGDFTMVHRRHTIQMGADFSANNLDAWNLSVDDSFSTPQTSNLESPAGTGAGLASFLLGVPDSAQRRNTRQTTHGGWCDGLYIQDSWKAFGKLTVNIGLRYDLMLRQIYGDAKTGNQFVGNTDLDKGVYILANVPPACNAAAGVGAPCIPGGTLPANVIVTPFSNHAILHNSYDNWGPRLGLAYHLRPSTVVRAAAGKFFDLWSATGQMAQNYEGNWPSLGELISQNLNYPTSTTSLPNTTWQDPFHSGSGAVQLPAPNPFSQVNWMTDPRIQNAYSEQWNTGVQQSFGVSTILEADYVGSHDSRLDSGGIGNVARTPGPGDIAPREPFPYITPTFYDKSIGRASYNAFQFKLRRTATKGLSYIISYTWSKTMNTGCDGFFGSEGASIQQYYRLGADKSVAGFNVPQMLSANWTYDLPFGKGMRFSSGSKGLDAVIGNWALNGIFTIRSGEPFTLAVSGDIANIGGNDERPNIVGPPIPSNRTWQNYIDTSSYQVPAAYTFGDLGRNANSLGKASNLDLSVFRDFPLPLTEVTRLQFRAEFFNSLNHPVLGGCLDSTVQDPNFGIAGCTRNTERQIQFGLKFYF